MAKRGEVSVALATFRNLELDDVYDLFLRELPVKVVIDRDDVIVAVNDAVGVPVVGVVGGLELKPRRTPNPLTPAKPNAGNLQPATYGWWWDSA